MTAIFYRLDDGDFFSGVFLLCILYAQTDARFFKCSLRNNFRIIACFTSIDHKRPNTQHIWSNIVIVYMLLIYV